MVNDQWGMDDRPPMNRRAVNDAPKMAETFQVGMLKRFCHGERDHFRGRTLVLEVRICGESKLTKYIDKRYIV